MKRSSYTEQDCKDVGITIGMPEDKAVEFFHYYNGQDWFFNSGLKITNLKSAMWRWKNNQYKFEKINKKTKLPVLFGKTCSKAGCNLPAVYKSTGGDYDDFRCSEHLPAKVKEKYE